MRIFAMVLLCLSFALPAFAAEEGARPDIINVLTARLAIAGSVEEATELADALREAYGASDSASAQVLTSQAVVVAEEGDNSVALYKLSRALILDEDLVGALVLRGRVHLDVGLLDNAFNDAMNAVERAPDYYAGLGLLALTFEAQGRYVSALATTREALRYYPLNEELTEQLARHQALAAGRVGL